MNSLSVIFQQIDKQLSQIDAWQEVDSYRIFHGRGGCFPGAESFSVDVFFPVVLVTAFKPCDKDFLSQLTQGLIKRFTPLGFSCFLFQFRNGKVVENKVLSGDVPKNFVAKYRDLRFKLAFSQQNLGYFLDINPARRWLEQQAKGMRILNLFSYTCAFSVIAVQAGAHSVVNIDMSGKSLQIGRDNHLLNGLSCDNIQFLPHDIFRSWAKLARFGPYDLVIIDPPSRQKGSFLESKDYKRVWSRMPAMVADDGWVLSCLNSPLVSRSDFKQRAIQSMPDFNLIEELQPCESFAEKQAEYALKMLVFRRNISGV